MTSSSPKITAVVCTHDRAKLLDQALDSLLDQSLAPDEYEIVVVDNRSTDSTAEVVRSKLRLGAKLVYVEEPVLGLSHARNAGLDHAKADIIAFLDDDAVAAYDWLANICRAFVDFSAGVVCGPVDPRWATSRPHWLDDDLLSAFSVVDWSDGPRPLTAKEWVVGANMAISRHALANDRFDVRLGRSGDNLISSEETELINRIRSRDYAVIYDPTVRVAHHIHADRLRRRWYLKRMYAQGCSAYLIQADEMAHGGRYLLSRLKDIADVLARPNKTYVGGKSLMRRLGHIAEQLGKIGGYLSNHRR